MQGVDRLYLNTNKITKTKGDGSLEKYIRSSSESLNELEIKAYVNDFKLGQLATLKKLKKYYLGEQEIINRTMADVTKPNNRIVVNYCANITDTLTNYGFSSPIGYKSSDEGSQLLKEINHTNKYNDEGENSLAIAQDMSIYGRAGELIWFDLQEEIRFKRLNPEELIFIYEDNLESELNACIRFYEGKSILETASTTFIEVYEKDVIRYFTESAGVLSMNDYSESFGIVPVVAYENNTDLQGDFVQVISLQDAYNKIISDSVNDFEAFVDAYLCLEGMEDTDNTDILRMKENRVMLLPEGSKASWLVKTVQDTHVQNLLNRLNDNIHKVSQSPDVSDEKFSGNSSGEALKYKLLPLENKTSGKVNRFKRGLQKKIEIICAILFKLGYTYDFREIDFSFKRNIPEDITNSVEVFNKLFHLISNESALSVLPTSIVANVEDEIEKMNKVNEVYVNLEA